MHYYSRKLSESQKNYKGSRYINMSRYFLHTNILGCVCLMVETTNMKNVQHLTKGIYGLGNPEVSAKLSFFLFKFIVAVCYWFLT